ncbi:gamma-glutamyltranspeptidase [Vibrio ishigakensis]|uniref:Gamma-glutamyltranspeptidase n=1 Tax=Vibrio ishigakensis TaxID=1481914 RepID=A0A0B8QV27_9VIBR|nr:gamma-glutamyltranspeptidase [Vibrio ishigakensis]
MLKQFLTLSSSLLLSVSVNANQASDVLAPESATGWNAKPQVNSSKWMVTAANPIATQYAAEVLAQGGNAADALVVTQLVLSLVEPQSSGIGGGGFMLYWDNKTKKLTSFDARETAPLDIRPEHFIDNKGEPLPFLTPWSAVCL